MNVEKFLVRTGLRFMLFYVSAYFSDVRKQWAVGKWYLMTESYDSLWLTVIWRLLKSSSHRLHPPDKSGTLVTNFLEQRCRHFNVVEQIGATVFEKKNVVGNIVGKTLMWSCFESLLCGKKLKNLNKGKWNENPWKINRENGKSRIFDYR